LRAIKEQKKGKNSGANRGAAVVQESGTAREISAKQRAHNPARRKSRIRAPIRSTTASSEPSRSALTPGGWPILDGIPQAELAHYLRADCHLLGRVSAVVARARNRRFLFVFSLFT
jgi:hypothetical protein